MLTTTQLQLQNIRSVTFTSMCPGLECCYSILQNSRQPLHLLCFYVKLVKSGHVAKPVFHLRGNPACHVGVFDFPSMTAPHRKNSLQMCQMAPDMASVSLSAVWKNQRVSPEQWVGHARALCTFCHTFVDKAVIYIRVHAKRNTQCRLTHCGVYAHVMQEYVGPGWQLSRLLWFQCLDTLPNKPIICCGDALCRGLALPQGADLGQLLWDRP